MCERRVAVALLTALLALAPMRAAAQGIPTEAELESELARLTPLYLEAERQADLVESARAASEAAAAQQVTIQVGPLRIVTSRSQAELARRVFEAEWARFDAMTRGRTGPLERLTILFYQGPPQRFLVQGATREVRAAKADSEARMRSLVGSMLASVVDELLPSTLRRSAGMMPPLRAARPLEEIYRDLASAPTTLAHACFEGDVDACWRGMGQMDASADRIATWLTPAEQRSIAWRAFSRPGYRVSQLRDECLAGSDAACTAVTRSPGNGTWPIPASASASLLWFALERGGVGALDRLWRSWDPLDRSSAELTASDMEQKAAYRAAYRAALADDQPAAELQTLVPPAFVELGEFVDIRSHLSAAAGMDGNAVMREWLAQVRAARPAPPAPDRRARTSTLLWITLLVALAARSTRWRLA